MNFNGLFALIMAIITLLLVGMAYFASAPQIDSMSWSTRQMTEQ